MFQIRMMPFIGEYDALRIRTLRRYHIRDIVEHRVILGADDRKRWHAKLVQARKRVGHKGLLHRAFDRLARKELRCHRTCSLARSLIHLIGRSPRPIRPQLQRIFDRLKVACPA